MTDSCRAFAWAWLGAVILVAACAQGSGGQDPVDSGHSLVDAGPGSDAVALWDGGGECPPDPLPETAGATCANAIDLGMLSDVTGDFVTATGNGMPAGRAIWWTFQAIDDTDTSGDEFHVDVRFLVNSSDAYEMAVHRNTCSPGDEICGSTRGTFDWYTDFAATSSGCPNTSPCGEGDCVGPPGQEGPNVCEDNTARFYVRVQRTDSAGSCEGFTLELSNGKYSSM
ncbi:MAG: hypothetical protein ABI333_16720 [bacterium]